MWYASGEVLLQLVLTETAGLVCAIQSLRDYFVAIALAAHLQ